MNLAEIKPYLMTTTLTAPYIYYTSVANIPQEAQTALEQANEAFDKQDVQKVTELYTKAVTAAQKSAHLWCNLGAILSAQGIVNEGIQALKKAIEIDATNAGAQYNLGTTYLSHGMLKEALEHLKRAYDIENTSAPIVNNFAVANLHAGNRDQAFKLFEEVVVKHPTFDYGFHNLGALAYDASDYQAATNWYKKALDVSPHNYATYNDLACAQLMLGDQKQALQDLAKSLEINNRYKMAYYNLGYLVYIQKLVQF